MLDEPVLIHQIGGAAHVASRLIGPETAFGAISPENEPDLQEASWHVRFTDRPSGEVLASVPITLNVAEAELLWSLVDGLSDVVPRSWRYWGRPFPECDAHSHPARVRMHLAEDGEPIGVALRCPWDDHVVGVITS
jgi:hypothetical protein